jgi:hypothetical protein
LLYEVGGFDCFGHEVREEPHCIGNRLQHRFIIEDFDGKRHIHDRLPRHEVGSNLLEYHFYDALLGFEDLLVLEDQTLV